MTVSSIGNDIFIGGSAVTSHMTNNRTGVYDLIPIRGSVMIGNGESISCTHKGKLDVICKHKDGSTAQQTWEVKIVPHDGRCCVNVDPLRGREKSPQISIRMIQTSRLRLTSSSMGLILIYIFLILPLAATVKAIEMYHMDFDMAVNYLKSFIEDGSSDCRNLSSAQQNDNEGKGNTKGGKLKVEARFYKPSEWVKLSFNEQQKVCNLQVKHAKAQQKHKSAQAKVNDDDEKQDK